MNHHRIKTTSLIIFLLLGCCFSLSSQNAQDKMTENGNDIKRHSLGLLLGHTYIDQGIKNEESAWISAPSFGLNYNYRLSEKWMLGLHSDIIIESFAVELSSERETIEREYPLSNVLMASYFIKERWSIAAGAGIEWEKNEHFEMFRFGTEYALELTKNSFEVLFILNYDILIEGPNTINFGIGINKLF